MGAVWHIVVDRIDRHLSRSRKTDFARSDCAEASRAASGLIGLVPPRSARAFRAVRGRRRFCPPLCGIVRLLEKSPARPAEDTMSNAETELSDEQSRQVAETIREEIARRRLSRQALAEQAKLSLSTLEKAL